MKGKQSKLTKTFLMALKEVIHNELDVIFLTDNELLSLINEKLPVADKIAQRTFREWKAGDTPKHLPEEAKQFRLLIKRAIIKQKLALFQKMMDAKSSEWQKYTWLIERKFPEWNIRNKIDITPEENRIVKITMVHPTNPNPEATD